MVFLCCFVLFRGVFDSSGNWLMARSMWRNHTLRKRMFCSRTGRSPEWGPVNTPSCHHPKCQDSEKQKMQNCTQWIWKSLAWSSSESWIALLWSISKLGCPGACLLTKDQSFHFLLRASAYGVLASGAAWLPSTVLAYFNFLPLLYSLVCLFFLVICAIFQVNFLSLTIVFASQIHVLLV